MSLIVIPFKDEPEELIARNISTAARHDRVREVWGVAADETRITGRLLAATRAVGSSTSKTVDLFAQERIGSFRPGKGDAMNTAIDKAAARGWERVHFYDSDITNFDESWIDGAEEAADRGFGVVRHRFPRASTDAMITWMITRPGLAIAFPGTPLPRINQPLGGEILVGGPALAALATSIPVRARSDWGIDTLITYETATLEGGMYEHHVSDGKRHALYGALDELRPMAVECLDAVISLMGRPGPPAEHHHSSEEPSPTPPDLKRTLAYDVEASMRLLTSGWTIEEIAVAETLPREISRHVLENTSTPTFAFMDSDTWYATLLHMIDSFRLGDAAWESLAFRLWLIRVMSYTTNQALAGYGRAMDYLEETIGDYEKWSLGTAG